MRTTAQAEADGASGGGRRERRRTARAEADGASGGGDGVAVLPDVFHGLLTRRACIW